MAMTKGREQVLIYISKSNKALYDWACAQAKLQETSIAAILFAGVKLLKAQEEKDGSSNSTSTTSAS